MTELSFSNVTQAGVDALDRYLAEASMTRSPGAQGHVSGQDMEMDFALDLAGGRLILHLTRVPQNISAEHIAYAVRTMLASGKPFGVAGRTAERVGHRWSWG